MTLQAQPHLSMHDHHPHKHVEEDEGGEHDEGDGESPARNKVMAVQLFLQVRPAIHLARQSVVF